MMMMEMFINNQGFWLTKLKNGGFEFLFLRESEFMKLSFI